MTQKQEKFTNFGQSTLNGAINSSTTSVVVVSASSFPSSGQFRLVVDQEIMLVTNISSNTLTVIRGYESTAAVSHNDGSDAWLLMSAGIMEAIYPKGRKVSGSPINLATLDGVLEVDNTDPSPVTVNLPTDPILYKLYTVIDFGGNAGTHNITVTDGGSFSDVIDQDGLSGGYYFNGTVWKVIKSSGSGTSGGVPTTRTINGHALDNDIVLDAEDVGAPAGSGTSTGDNTGDQILQAGRRITASGAVTMDGTTDQIIEIAKTVPAATIVNLPSSPVQWKLYTVKDGGFNCSSNNITLTPPSGNIDGSSTAVMNRDGQSLSFYWNGTNWRIA